MRWCLSRYYSRITGYSGDLLGIAHDATAYPDDIPGWRLAELLLRWAEQYVSGEDWKRLQARVRKQRR